MANDGDRIGVEPAMWFVVFTEKPHSWWVDLLAWGRFKHALALGWLPDQYSWLLYEVSIGRTRVALLPDCAGSDELIAGLRKGNVTLAMKPGAEHAPWARLGFWCVPAMAHLLGIKGQPLRPDALYRACLEQGAEVVDW